jgi:membrane protein
MFKWLPDTDIAWGDVWLGAIVTAALFEIRKLLIGLYIGKLALESTYGAAASIVVVLALGLLQRTDRARRRGVHAGLS